jgi:hypothetical protein
MKYVWLVFIKKIKIYFSHKAIHTKIIAYCNVFKLFSTSVIPLEMLG